MGRAVSGVRMMLRKLGFLIVALGMALPAFAAGRESSISGYVRDSAGAPQMGAMVELLSSTLQDIHLFTDENGHFTAAGLVPGMYNIRVSAPLFLPALKERIGLRAGGAVVVNLTLSTLFDGLQLAPARGVSDDDDWKWVLRSAANRPILRILNGQGQVTPVSGNNPGRAVKGSVAFVAGSPSDGFGSTSDMSTVFALEKSVFSTGTMGFSGNLGYGNESPATVLRFSYTHQLQNGSSPKVALTMRRFQSPDAALHDADLEALALNTSDTLALGNVVEIHVGSELQTIQFMGRVTAFRPFGSADIHLSPNTVVEYAYTTSEPNTREQKGFDTAPADLSESGPHMSIAGFSPTIEHAHHHEVSFSHRMGQTNLQIAGYFDRVGDPALTGVGDTSGLDGYALSDPYSGTFTYRGRNFETNGMRLVLQHRIASDLIATLAYEYGGVLDLEKSNVALQDVQANTSTVHRQSILAKASGTLSCTKTQWIASYRWMDGNSLTPVDWFNASPGQADPYFNFFIRQPIPGTGFIPGHIEALIDLRNLLAQGYVPVMGADGRTIYLVQSARTVRGGITFNF